MLEAKSVEKDGGTGTHARDDPEMFALRDEIRLNPSFGRIFFSSLVDFLSHRLNFGDHFADRQGGRVFPVCALERDEGGNE